MNQTDSWLRNTTLQFIRFGIVGAMNVIINVVAYVALVWLGVHYLIASLIGSSLGVINGFLMSKFFVFGVRGDAARQFFKTLSVYAVQIAVSWAGLIIFIEFVGLNPYLAYAANIFVVTVVSFFGLKLFAFRSNHKSANGLTGDESEFT